MQLEVYQGIITDLEVLDGKPIIAGTQAPVSVLVNQIATGKTMEEVAEEYHITLEGVRAALKYAAQLVDAPVNVSDPLRRLAGIVSSDDPGWGDHHDEYFGSEEFHAQEP